jgi:hypothetical protein
MNVKMPFSITGENVGIPKWYCNKWSHDGISEINVFAQLIVYVALSIFAEVQNVEWRNGTLSTLFETVLTATAHLIHM